MNKYQNGKIYKIVCNTTNLTFYGSTTEPNINRNLAGHKANLKKANKNDISYKVLENNNYKIELIEAYVCNSKEELLNREQYVDFIHSELALLFKLLSYNINQ
jgi:hypothetical protein